MRGREEIGYVISASTNEGIISLLKDYETTEDIATNSIAIIEGKKRKYLAIISEIFHSSGSEKASNVAKYLSENGEARKVGEKVFTSLSAAKKFSTSLRLIPLAQTTKFGIEEVDTIPIHTGKIYPPTDEDIETFYGKMDEKINWGIGYTKQPIKDLESNIMIPINIDILTRGSFGIFGKSGTGKTHLGNILASLIIISNKQKKLDKPIKLLIFDMHSEYGLKVKDQHGNDYADGVGLIFKNDFKVYTPDYILAKEFGLEEFIIDPRELNVEDLEILKENLDLTPSFIDYLYQFRRIINETFEKDKMISDESLKKDYVWILYLLGFLDERKDIEKELRNIENQIEKKVTEYIGIGSLSSLRAGKGKLSALKRYEFIRIDKKDTISEIVDEIFYREKSVIISFGRYGDDPRAYTLIAHLLSKKLWQRAINEIMSGRQLKYKLVIFLEEAHKFLSGELYYKTAFGNIARELRKRGIVLCIIDQRPSQISEDVLGMLWNSFVFSLTTKVDIEAATRGLKYSHLFLPVVESLKRKEALIFGDAISLPAIVSIRDYKEFAKSIKDLYINNLMKLDIPGY